MTTAGGVLARSVTLRDDDFRLVTFPAGSTPPAWASALITTPSAWESAPAAESTPEPEDPAQEDAAPAVEEAPPAEAPGVPDEPEEDLVGELPEPPKRGAGSGRDAWVAYANSKGITFAPDASRDDIIAATEA